MFDLFYWPKEQIKIYRNNRVKLKIFFKCDYIMPRVSDTMPPLYWTPSSICKGERTRYEMKEISPLFSPILVRAWCNRSCDDEFIDDFFFLLGCFYCCIEAWYIAWNCQIYWKLTSIFCASCFGVVERRLQLAELEISVESQGYRLLLLFFF